jgi:hypothetical protein
VLPEVVQENADGYMSVTYGNMVALLVEGIKELSAKCVDQEKRLAVLETISHIYSPTQ